MNILFPLFTIQRLKVASTLFNNFIFYALCTLLYKRKKKEHFEIEGQFMLTFSFINIYEKQISDNR